MAMPGPLLTPYGEHGLLLEIEGGAGGADRVAAWTAALAAAQLPGVVDLVPAARSVLLLLADDVAPGSVLGAVARLDPAVVEHPGIASEADVVEIPVRYDGPDLADVAAHCGLGPREVVAAHCSRPWRVEFAGFAPGFAYLGGGDPRLVVPRRASPRTAVPAGSVALAAGYTAVYPRSSPGGWQLIGRTEAAMWDLGRRPPALLRVGQLVRFTAVDP